MPKTFSSVSQVEINAISGNHLVSRIFGFNFLLLVSCRRRLHPFPTWQHSSHGLKGKSKRICMNRMDFSKHKQRNPLKHLSSHGKFVSHFATAVILKTWQREWRKVLRSCQLRRNHENALAYYRRKSWKHQDSHGEQVLRKLLKNCI